MRVVERPVLNNDPSRREFYQKIAVAPLYFTAMVSVGHLAINGAYT
jgi:hypothetical protein